MRYVVSTTPIHSTRAMLTAAAARCRRVGSNAKSMAARRSPPNYHTTAPAVSSEISSTA